MASLISDLSQLHIRLNITHHSTSILITLNHHRFTKNIIKEKYLQIFFDGITLIPKRPPALSPDLANKLNMLNLVTINWCGHLFWLHVGIPIIAVMIKRIASYHSRRAPIIFAPFIGITRTLRCSRCWGFPRVKSFWFWYWSWGCHLIFFNSSYIRSSVNLVLAKLRKMLSLRNQLG